MILKKIKLLSEALWESVKRDPDFFSSIQLFVKRLAEVSFTEEGDIEEALIYIGKIRIFFDRYVDKPDSQSIYFSPSMITNNQDSVSEIEELLKKISMLNEDALRMELEKLSVKSKSIAKGGGKIFIGHGRSKLWARVQLFLKDDLDLGTIVFEDESRTSQSIIEVLSEFLNEASFAILILTAEDETADLKVRARQNVIHEAGLFQGRLGFDKVIILKQNSIEEFSNLAGLQYIQFEDDNIEQTFYELRRKLIKLGVLKKHN